MPRLQCPNCQGTGYTRIGLTSLTCDKCEGTGHIYASTAEGSKGSEESKIISSKLQKGGNTNG